MLAEMNVGSREGSFAYLAAQHGAEAESKADEPKPLPPPTHTLPPSAPSAADLDAGALSKMMPGSSHESAGLSLAMSGNLPAAESDCRSDTGAECAGGGGDASSSAGRSLMFGHVEADCALGTQGKMKKGLKKLFGLKKK